MRLLEYSDGKLKLTDDLVSNIPRYAILSHTWGSDAEEVTFEDLVDGTGEKKTGYKKIRFCATQAEHDGLRYIWVDTCCIDKSDDDEVNRSMRSMFHWYHNAARCYVYLFDVSITGYNQPGQQRQYSWESAFQASRWHTRGWTLQELLAPSSVEFFTQEGISLGDKWSLGQQIHKITKIPILALREASLSQFSVHERMTWAKTRQTTIEEDRAYCLQGIFGVYVPVSYGEGEENAMRRLKMEIDEASNPERQRRAKQLEQGAYIESKDGQDQMLLSYAAANGRGAVVKQLLKQGADVESRDGHGRTLLSYAAANGNEAIVKLLLKQGADVKSRDGHGRTPLSYAAANGCDAVVQKLLKKGADVESRDGHGRTPLSYAAANGCDAVVQKLLKKGADIESKDGHDQTPQLQRQLKHGADAKPKNSYFNRTPLSYAAANGRDAIVQQLLKLGADVESKDAHGRTPLLWAAENGNEAVVKLLLTTGKANVNAENDDTCTPLVYAAKNGHKAVVDELLLARKVDVDVRNKWVRTPLSYAAENGHKTIVEILLDTGKVDIDAKDMFGRTPLSYAAEKGHETVVERLLMTGKVDINSKTTPGCRTPLLYAEENGREAVVKLLLATRPVSTRNYSSCRTQLSYTAERG